MSGSILDMGLYLLAAAIFGGLIGWLIRGRQYSRRIGQLNDDWLTRFETAGRLKEKLRAENISLKSSLEAEKAIVRKHEFAATKSVTELESAREKSNALSKNLFVLSAERDELIGKLSSNQDSLNAAVRRVTELQAEFTKAGEFYKGQLENAFNQRKALERKIGDANSERESLSNLLMSVRSEHESVNKLLSSAQARLKNLDALESKVIALEAENAQLRHDATLATREAESMQRDVAEINALKVQNRELAHCLESMENSRKQHEIDAHRYRSQYDKSEQESETLRIKLDEIENHLADLHQKHDEARTNLITDETAQEVFGQDTPQGDSDDLTEIVGIGKVFEETLHNLGIFRFQQIAAFGPADIAKINVELKEFKGRMEHDDWIGQAKELHFKKYGGTDEK